MKCDYCGKEIKQGEDIINLGEKNACEHCHNQSKKYAETKIRNKSNSSTQKYPDLAKSVGGRNIYGFCIKTASVLAGGFFLIKESINILTAVTIVICGFYLGNFVVALGEFVQVVIDIEENTRKN